MLKKIFSAPILFCVSLFLVFPVCVSYQLLDPFVTPRIVLIAATVLVLLLIVFLQSRNENGLRLNISVYVFLIFLLLYAFSISKSLNPGDAWFEWMKSFAGFSVLILSAYLFQKEENRNTLLKFSQISILILSSVYCYQWIYFLNHQNLEKVWDLKIHIASTLGNKNFYAEVICLLFPFSVISFFTLDKKWKAFSGFNIIILLISFALTQSYAVLAAFFVAAVFASMIFYVTLPERKIVAIKVSGGVAIAVLIFASGIYKSGAIKSFNQRVETIQHYIQNPELIDSTTRANSNSTFERIMLWRNSFELIKENPLTGCGANNWKLLYPKFGIGGTRYIEGGNVHYEHPHNDYLLIASEAGIPAMIVFLFFFISLGWISVREMKRNNESRLWLAGILFSVICFSIISIFSFPRMRFYAWILLFIYAGILLALSLKEKVTATKASQTLWRITLLACAAISLWTLLAAVIRFNSEIHSKQLQLAKKQMNLARVLREAERASSFYFPVDETATPFTWYKGMALFYSHDVPQSRIAYEDALKKNPYHIQLLNDLATSCEQSDERERAVELYQRALSVTPLFPHSLLNLSACYFNMGKKDSAFIYIDKIYGIRLNGQEQKSYDVFLPAILREKIYSEEESFPVEIKDSVIAKATDGKCVSDVYLSSKKQNVSFEKMLADSVVAGK